MNQNFKCSSQFSVVITMEPHPVLDNLTLFKVDNYVLAAADNKGILNTDVVDPEAAMKRFIGAVVKQFNEDSPTFIEHIKEISTK